MFYRRKVILALLEVFDGKLGKIRLQKLLFLFTRQQALAQGFSGKTEYDFIPFKFGCYSYSANADMGAMVKRGFLKEDDQHFELNDENTTSARVKYFDQLIANDKKNVLEIKAIYGRMSSSALMKYTYLNFPFYAIRSEVAEKI